MLSEEEKQSVYDFFKGKNNLNLEDIDTYIKKGFDINVPEENGATVLFYACQKLNLEWVKFLIERKCIVQVECNQTNLTPLKNLFLYDNDDAVEIFKILLDSETCDINFQSSLHGYTTLMLMCKQICNSDSGINYCIKYFDLLIKHEKCLLDLQDCQGVTALMYCCEGINDSKAKFIFLESLIKNGCNINEQDNNGRTALMFLIINERFSRWWVSTKEFSELNVRAAKLLLETNQCRFFGVKNIENLDHLMLACSYKRDAIVKLLLAYDHPIDPNFDYGEFQYLINQKIERKEAVKRNKIGVLLLSIKKRNVIVIEQGMILQKTEENPLNILPKELIHLILSYSHPGAIQTKYCQQ